MGSATRSSQGDCGIHSFALKPAYTVIFPMGKRASVLARGMQLTTSYRRQCQTLKYYTSTKACIIVWNRFARGLKPVLHISN